MGKLRKGVNKDITELDGISIKKGRGLKRNGITKIIEFKQKMQTPKGIVDLLEVDGLSYKELKDIYVKHWGELDLNIPEGSE